MAGSPSTYTTIPISGSDVISRSFQNLKSFYSQGRPWPELFAAAGFDRPESFSAAIARIRKNAVYFRVNYAIFLTIFVLLSLIETPIILILIAGNLSAWLVLYFFREDPLLVLNYQLNDRAVLIGLIVLTLIDLWFTGVAGNLIVAAGIGLLIVAVYGAFRNPDSVFLDEQEALSAGLIRSGSNGRPVIRSSV